MQLSKVAIIVGVGLVALGLVAGLAFDRVGAVELLLSGIVLFLLRDIITRRESPYFQKHPKAPALMIVSFSSSLLILLFLGALELLFYYAIDSIQVGLLAAKAIIVALFVVGIVPYIFWNLGSRKGRVT